jgi:hypothetical protein
MGRMLDLCGEVAAVAEEGPAGLVLDETDRQRFLETWLEEDIDDALSLVHDSLLQGELVESADSLNARLIELLGEFGDALSFSSLAAGEGVLEFEAVGQLCRRVARLEDILAQFRDAPPPDTTGFQALRERLADYGIEEETEAGRYGTPEETN